MRIPATVTFTLLLAGASPAAPPSPQDLERRAAYARQRDARLERAEPWKAALAAALPAEADSTRRLLFLITYKHHVQDSGLPPPAGLEGKARAFAKTWSSIRRDCAKAKVEAHALAQAVYRLTNSDWAPVSAAMGPGLDRVAKPAHLKSWSVALIKVSRKARRAGLEPTSVWENQAASYLVNDPEDFDKAGLTPPPVRH